MRAIRLLVFFGFALVGTYPGRVHAQSNLPPYSAEFKTTTVRTLANGTTIIHQATGMEARDSTGRTYREETREIGESGNKVIFISIFDPTAFEFINLNPRDKTATISRFPPPKPPTTSGPSVSSGSTTTSAHARPVGEKLGTKDIDGVTVQGTRTTRTIPSGQDGNDQPLVITTERWFSAELGVTLNREIDDPRNGVTTTEYSNIQRGEPDPALFQIPDDYTVKEVERVTVAH